MMAPGTRALAFASRWFDPALVHRTFEPLVADWQREWYESAPARRPWVSVRAWAAFVCAAAISTPAIVATPVPRSISWRVAKRVTIFCLVAVGALSIPMVRSMDGRELDPPLWAALLLRAWPEALVIAFPFAMVLAVDGIRRGAVPAHVERAAALKLGVIAVCFMLMARGFVAPLASREFVILSTPTDWNIPQPRLQQLSTVALLTHPERTTAIPATPQYTRAGEIRRELMNRAMLSVMPAMFIWLRWSSPGQRTRRRFGPLPTWAMTAALVAATFGTFYAGGILEFKWGLLPGTGFVLPLLVFSIWGFAEQRFARRGQGAGDLFDRSGNHLNSPGVGAD